MESLLLIGVTIVWFLLVLSFLVLIHELGHFLAAKWIGTHVEEFGLGYPPRVKKVFTKWHTVFTLNALPFGGFVRIWGDDAEQIEDDAAQSEKEGKAPIVNPAPKGSIPFANQPQWKRMVVILAGITVNFVFGMLAFAILYSFVGIPERVRDVEVLSVQEDSPAAAAGLQVGDKVLSLKIDGETTWQQGETRSLVTTLGRLDQQDIQLTVERSGEQQELSTTTRSRDEAVARGALGFSPSENTDFVFYPAWQMPFRGAWTGVKEAVGLSQLIVLTLGDMVTGVSRGKVPSDVSGPVGIVEQAVQMEVVKQGWYGTLNWAGLLSINLAVMNLLPIPALDGGRAVFIILETFIGKARRLRWERLVNGYSFFFLIGLILLITLKDVVGLIF